jgi:Flp pilus assembly pilin Flp
MYLLLKRLAVEEDGQGLIEYTFVVLLAALVFWLGVRDTDVGTTLTTLWVKITDCVNAPFSCTA